jgi:hypothetical protein
LHQRPGARAGRDDDFLDAAAGKLIGQNDRKGGCLIRVSAKMPQGIPSALLNTAHTGIKASSEDRSDNPCHTLL